MAETKELIPRGATPEERTPILLVGGGLTGLSTAVFLGAQGVASLVVERHPDLLIHPRARGFNPRTVELYRQVGLEPAMLAARNFAGDPSQLLILRAETLASAEYELIEPGVGERFEAMSPSRLCMIDQDRLEVLLRDRARELGAEVRFATEMVSFQQDEDGVRALIRDLRTGTESTVGADYLVAADGYRSQIRERLAIPTDGPGALWHTISLVFEADLNEALHGRRSLISYLNRPRPGTVLMPHDGVRRWAFGTGYVPQPGETLEDFSDERCAELIRAAVGVADLDVRIVPQIPGTNLKVLAFVISGQVAQRYRVGRVFLAGDAAHTMPPTGGFGANVGIQDAHNVAWKLAMVLRGQAGPELLDTYEVERRPVAEFTLGQALARMHARILPGTGSEAPPMAEYASVVFGYRYRSPAVLGVSNHGGPALNPAQLAGQPGTRAPHVPLTRDGEETSTLDLYGRHFVLLAGPDGAAWVTGARRAAARLGLPLDAYRFGAELGDAGRGAAAHGVGSAGAVLVRPDGFVAWRSQNGVSDPQVELAEALRSVLARD